MARRKRKTRTHHAASGESDLLYDSTPKSFVIRQGKTAKCVRDLVGDMRSMMMPWTAKNLKERSDNTVKDFISVAGPLRITHLIVFSQRGAKVFMKLGRLPGGPTLTFSLHSYSLQRDIRTALRNSPGGSPADYQQSPLVVLSGFRSHGGNEEQSKMDANAAEVMRKTFNALFPNIDIREIKANAANRRVVLFVYLGGGQVEVRQYTVHRRISGVSEVVKQLYGSQKKRKIELDQQSLSTILEQVKKIKEEPKDSDDENDEKESVSRTSQPPSNVVQITKTLRTSPRNKRQKIKAEEEPEEIEKLKLEMNISLAEIGPRISMHLTKVEEGVFDGIVLPDVTDNDGSEEGEEEEEMKEEGQ